MHGAYADELQQAKALEKAGHASQAIAAYRSWMAANPHGPKWDAALLRMADLMQDPKEAVATLLDSLAVLSTDSARHEAYVKIGELDELLGDWSAAQESFQNASLVPGTKDYQSLLESARILTQLGQTAKASGQVRSIIAICPDQTVVAEAQVLSAKLDAITGKTGRATKQIEAMLGSGAVSTLSAQSLAELYDACARLNLQGDRAVVADLLAQKFPKSPEQSLIAGKTTPVPSPAGLLGYHDGPYAGAVAPASSPVPAPAPASGSGTAAAASGSTPAGTPTASPSTAAATIDIQIGSYLDPTNAQYRLRDLTSAGFTGKILKASIQGKLYYKVVVPRVPTDQSQYYLTRLKEKGFEGFLLYD